MREGHEGGRNEVVKKHVDISLETVTGNIQEIQSTVIETKAESEEQTERERELRRSNVVPYKVLESSEGRVEERNKADLAFCLQLMNSCLNLGVVEEDITRVYRLGPRDRGTESPRPLLVQFARYTSKNLLMENLYKLRHAEQKFKGIVVTHDMTRSERDECKKLVAEAKSMGEQDQSGEYLYKVRGNPGLMKIVKMRKRF